MPVYKESLHTVLVPSIESLKKAMQTSRQGGTFINNDGLRLLSPPDRDEHLAYYANHQPPLKRALSPADACSHRVVPAPAPLGLACRVDRRAPPVCRTALGISVKRCCSADTRMLARWTDWCTCLKV
jgi:hypothetical protein